MTGATTAAARTPVQEHGALRVQGNRIVDQHGKHVVLRGMSLFWSQWQGKYYNRAVVRTLAKDWHADVVRAAMGVHSGGYLERPAAEMRKVEKVIDAAIAEGIYVIVDWHAHDPEPKAAADFFARIARNYGRHPNIIYETYNEPLPKHGWAAVLKPYHNQVIASIRAADPDNLIVAGTRSWSQDVDEAAADPLADPNTAYTLHFYAGTHRQPLRDKADRAMKLGAALFVTEWGSTDANGNGNVDVAETRRWFDFMEKNKLSYLNWSIADKNESSAALLPGASPSGKWPDNMISQSGKLTRDQLRRMNTTRKGN
ncbi:glycoside hydrolase family 5 protein [Sphingomonas piscis]|uniref:Glycoside hydrolase family 5 protein n=1 Tax=Sphingomonas piscis TaxID=2714943 RepID=A0A6G7YT61_9SPHN|nr:glycoside hydrolase family 5 protein [Sphingomonas piscis]